MNTLTNFIDPEEKEREAIIFMLDEIDLTLAHTHRYRARFDMIFEDYENKKNLTTRQKRILVSIYEYVTEADFGKPIN